MSKCTGLTSLNIATSVLNNQGLVDAIAAGNFTALQSLELLSCDDGRPFGTVKNLLPQLENLTRLNTNIWEDHRDVSKRKFTNLDSLLLWIQPTSQQEEDDIDVSPIMALVDQHMISVTAVKAMIAQIEQGIDFIMSIGINYSDAKVHNFIVVGYGPQLKDANNVRAEIERFNADRSDSLWTRTGGSRLPNFRPKILK